MGLFFERGDILFIFIPFLDPLKISAPSYNMKYKLPLEVTPQLKKFVFRSKLWLGRSSVIWVMTSFRVNGKYSGVWH